MARSLARRARRCRRPGGGALVTVGIAVALTLAGVVGPAPARADDEVPQPWDEHQPIVRPVPAPPTTTVQADAPPPPPPPPSPPSPPVPEPHASPVPELRVWATALTVPPSRALPPAVPPTLDVFAGGRPMAFGGRGDGDDQLSGALAALGGLVTAAAVALAVWRGRPPAPGRR